MSVCDRNDKFAMVHKIIRGWRSEDAELAGSTTS